MAFEREQKRYKGRMPPPTTVQAKNGASYEIGHGRGVPFARILNRAEAVHTWSYRTRRVMIPDGLEIHTPDFHIAFVDGTYLFVTIIERNKRAWRALLEEDFKRCCPIPFMAITTDEVYDLMRRFRQDVKVSAPTVEECRRWGWT